LVPFFVVVTWRVVAWGMTVMASGERSETLQIAYYPFIFITAAGFGFLALVLFFDFLQACRPLRDGDEDLKTALPESADES